MPWDRLKPRKWHWGQYEGKASCGGKVWNLFCIPVPLMYLQNTIVCLEGQWMWIWTVDCEMWRHQRFALTELMHHLDQATATKVCFHSQHMKRPPFLASPPQSNSPINAMLGHQTAVLAHCSANTKAVRELILHEDSLSWLLHKVSCGINVKRRWSQFLIDTLGDLPRFCSHMPPCDWPWQEHNE